MLYVLLLLLKILGILLLLLIGLVLLVLLIPFRYSFELEKEEQKEPKFMVRVTWLFWLFYFKTSYIEKVFDYRIRILGYQIAGNQPEFLEKQKERQKKKSQKEKAKEERKKNKEDREKQQEEKSGKPNKKKNPEESVKDTQAAVTEKELSVKKEPEEDILRSNASADIPQSMSAETPAEGKSRSIDSVSKQKAEKAVPKEKSSDVSEGREKTKEKDSGDDKNSKDKKKNKEKKQKDGKKQKKESSLKKIKGKIKSLKETKVNLDKMPWREWLELGKDVLIRFLKHVLPGKIEGNIAFGTGNPEYTGYITGIAAIFYPKYGEYFSLYPDFERKMFEAKCRGRGRIRPGYMLVLAVSILKEKSVRTMIKNIILG